ncbi:YutD family protein [Carnobacteriaceae bacterium zg-ZUI78]|nr:YutD family protein [Carnobacteriaceae bacterium zg-ZUI78]
MENEEIKIQDIPEAKVFVKENLVFINEHEYTLEVDFKNGFQIDALEDRYTKLLQKYHYIVGDWGHNQLRLKGFYKNDMKNVEEDSKIYTLEDYLREYCAFGCAYFVLSLNGNPVMPKENAPHKSNQQKRKKQNTSNHKKYTHQQKQPQKEKTKKHAFVIRKGDKKA